MMMLSINSFALVLFCLVSLGSAQIWSRVDTYSDSACTERIGTIVNVAASCSVTPADCTATSHGSYYTAACIDSTSGAPDPNADPVPVGFIKYWGNYYSSECDNGVYSALIIALENTCIVRSTGVRVKLASDCGPSDPIVYSVYFSSTCDVAPYFTANFTADQCGDGDGAGVAILECGTAVPSSPVAEVPTVVPMVVPVAGPDSQSPTNNAPTASPVGSNAPSKKSSAAVVQGIEALIAVATLLL